MRRWCPLSKEKWLARNRLFTLVQIGAAILTIPNTKRMNRMKPALSERR
jgi:hypothetical protein